MGKVIVGVDYGSKTSGFTCAALMNNGVISVHQSLKNKDADKWLKQLLEPLKPDVIGIDAPLSLPGPLVGIKGAVNYHYRKADIQAKAMSPMFLGGLTARAIELSDWFNKTTSSAVIEVYPKLTAQELQLDFKRYKKDKSFLPEAKQALANASGWNIEAVDIDNWHQYDALMALRTVEQYLNEKARTLGDKTEGLIYF
ncbi:MAG TPA: hypothetical protein DIT65_08140 [Cryomorphaceae bacterium]|nr:hypothetical protein [Cryomorphaceae bacterium]|tara:strand:- start:110 stop:703 length:594 start_codon:yes stop_codon:yes gene_type:complete